LCHATLNKDLADYDSIKARMQGKAPSIVALSAITANNLGDDGTLIAVVRDIQRLRPEAAITVLAEIPELCQPVCEQVDVHIERSLQLFVQAWLRQLELGEKPATQLRILAEQILGCRTSILSGESVPWLPAEYLPGLRRLMTADGVIDCGGANHTCHWKSYFFEKCLDYFLASKPLFVSSQGIDPFDDPDDIGLLVSAMSQASEITVRESISENYLHSIGCNTPLSTTGDDTLTLEPCPPERTEHLLAAANMRSGEPYLAFQYRHFFDYAVDHFLSLFAEFVDEAIGATGLPVLGVPMHFSHTDEREHLKAVWARVRHQQKFRVLDAHLTPGDAKSLFAKAHAAFGISYHSAVFSLSSGTPFLGLFHGSHYAQKMLGLSSLYGFDELAVPAATTQPSEFARLLYRTLERRELISAHLRSRDNELRQKVIESRERFVGVLANDATSPQI
jgi:colanic acid/amylovoran biosynthesis protein WcaK/AmsJ